MFDVLVMSSLCVLLSLPAFSVSSGQLASEEGKLCLHNTILRPYEVNICRNPLYHVTNLKGNEIGNSKF